MRWAALIGALAALGFAGNAHAAPEASVDGTTLTILVRNDATVAVTCLNGEIRVGGAGVNGAPCAPITKIALVSETSGPTRVDLTGADPALGYTSLESTQVEVGDEDELIGSPVPDVVRSGGSPASIEGRGGNDDIDVNFGAVDGGPGDDRLPILIGVGKKGPLTGGPGRDTVVMNISSLANRKYTLVADDRKITVLGVVLPYSSMEVVEARTGDGSQTLDATAFSGAAILHGGQSDDTLLGTEGRDSLFGGPGSDVFHPGRGRDRIVADGRTGLAGADTIEARDSVADTIDCGDEVDSVVADRKDRLTGCESIDVPPPLDARAPVIRLKKASLRGRNLKFTAVCPAERRCLGTARLRIGGARAGKVRLDLRGGRPRVVRRRISSRLRNRLSAEGAIRLSARLNVRDAAGNRTRKTVRTPLRVRG